MKPIYISALSFAGFAACLIALLFFHEARLRRRRFAARIHPVPQKPKASFAIHAMDYRDEATLADLLDRKLTAAGWKIKRRDTPLNLRGLRDRYGAENITTYHDDELNRLVVTLQFPTP